MRNGVIRDSITPWLAAGRPLFDNKGLPFSGNPTTNALKAQGLSSVLYRFNAVMAGQPVPFLTLGQTGGVEPFLGYWQNTALTLSPPNPDTTGPQSVTLADRSVYPWDVNYGGNGTRFRTDAWSAHVVVEQSLWDKVFLEAGYRREESDEAFLDLVRGLPRLHADPNLYRYDLNRTQVSNADLAGRYLLSHTAQSRGGEWYNARESYRLSAAGELDLTQRNAWLGRHRLLGFFQREARISTGVSGWDPRIVTPSAAAAAAGLQPGQRIRFRVYADDPSDPASQGIYWANIPYDFFNEVRLPDGTTVATITHPSNDPTNNPDLTRSAVTGLLGAVQSYWWGDRIITTYGRRHDKEKSVTVLPVRMHFRDYVEQGNFPAYDTVSSGPTESYGAVFHPLRWLWLHWNRSETFAPGQQGYRPDGSVVLGRHGKGRDMGFTVEPFGNRLSLRVNFFRNSDGPVNSSYTGAIRGRLLDIEETVTAAGAPAYGSLDFNQFDDYYFVSSEYEAEGTEIQLIGNVTPDWRLSVGLARTEAIESNIGGDWVQMVKERLPLYEQHADLPLVDNAGSTVRAAFRDAANALNEMLQADGRSADNIREWRFNATTRYTFREGWLKGAFVGGSYRWRSANAVGYRFNPDLPDEFPFQGVANASGSPDLSQPIEGDPLVNLDAFVGYSRRLFKDRVNWRLQLNVRNVLDEDAINVQRAWSDGTTRFFATQPPRQFILTSTFAF